MEEFKETVNIYLSSNNKEKVLDGSSSYERYIIVMNETLQVENRELKVTINNLELTNGELEDDNGKSEVSKRYTIGLLKNFAEIDKMRKKVVDKELKINNFNKRYVNALQHKAKLHLRYLQCILFTLFAVVWEFGFFSLDIFSFISLLVLFILSFIERLVQYISLPLHETEENIIEELLMEIKKITDAQDYLHEYLDAV